MKKLIEVSLKSIIFFIGWAICASVIPIPDIDNAALWRFFAELIPFLAIVVMSVIFWFVDRKKTKLHLTQRPVYSSVLGGTVGLSWLGISVGILLFTGSARIEGTNHISMLWLWITSFPFSSTTLPFTISAQGLGVSIPANTSGQIEITSLSFKKWIAAEFLLFFPLYLQFSPIIQALTNTFIFVTSKPNGLLEQSTIKSFNE